MNRPDSAPTDVPELIAELEGGQFELIVSKAISACSAATVDHGKASEVTLKFKIEHIPGTSQVRMQHDVKFSKPTSIGKTSEETSGATVLHVGRFGKTSLSQPRIELTGAQGTLNIPGAKD